MSAPEQPVDRVMVAVGRTAAHVRIVGRGSLKLGPALREFLAAAEGQGIRRACFDLAPCETLDSTILGIIAGSAMRLRRKGGGVEVAGLSVKTLGLFRTLGLDHLIVATPAGGDAGSAGEPWADPAPDRLVTLGRDAATRAADETILEAHEDLVAASADNLPRFRDVIEFMRDSVARRQTEGGGKP
jgi:anti-anti-sigma regulatory factor